MTQRFSNFNLRSIQGSRLTFHSLPERNVIHQLVILRWGKRCRISRGKYIRKKIRDRIYLNEARRSLPVRLTRVGYVHLLSSSAKKKQGRLCTNGSRNEGGWMQLPLEPLSISRYWTRDDTQERAAANYCVPSQFRSFASLFSHNISRSIPHLKIS